MSWTTPDEPWCAGRALANRDAGHALRLGLPYVFLYELFCWRRPGAVGQIAAAPDQVLVGALGEVTRTTLTAQSLFEDSGGAHGLDLIYVSGPSAQLAVSDHEDALVDRLNGDGLLIIVGDTHLGERTWTERLLDKYPGFRGDWAVPVTVVAPNNEQSWQSLIGMEPVNSMAVAYQAAHELDAAIQRSDILRNELHLASAENWLLREDLARLRDSIAAAESAPRREPPNHGRGILGTRFRRRVQG